MRQYKIMQSNGYDMLGGSPTYATFPEFTGATLPPSFGDSTQVAKLPTTSRLIPFTSFAISPQPSSGALFNWDLQVSMDNVNFFTYSAASTSLAQDEAFEMTSDQDFKWLVFRVAFYPLNAIGGASFLVSGYKEVDNGNS